MRTALSLLVVLVLVAGCLGGDGGPAKPTPSASASSSSDPPTSTSQAPAPAPAPVPRPTKAVPLTERTPVSGTHRVGEYALAVDPSDPQHVVLAGYDFDSSHGASYCNAFSSFDGGATWAMVELVPGPAGDWGGDPWVAIQPDGTIHVVCLTTSIVNGATTSLYTSRDRGATWSEPAIVAGVTDKEAVFADRDGTMLVCGSTRGVDGNSLGVQLSNDGGRTFAEPRFFAGLTNCNGVVQGPAGELHLVWLAVAGETREVGTLTSLDHGATWLPKVHVATHPYPNEFTNPDYYTTSVGTYTGPTGNWPNLAVSPTTGAVFFATDRDDVATGRTGALLRVSHDGGASFAVVELPAIPTALADAELSRPTMAVDAFGRLGIVLLANGGPAFSEREAWFLASADDGATWLPPLLLGATDALHSRLDPRAHAPNTNAPANQVMYVLNHPDYADTTFTQSALLLANSQQLEWGGDYGAIAVSSAGFVALWQDFAEGGQLRTYCRLVALE